MLFMVETTYREIDFGGRIEEYRKDHWKDLEKAHRDGVLLGLWRRVDGRGGIFILDLPSNEALRQFIMDDNLFAFYDDVKVVPLVGHPLFPQFTRPAADGRISKTPGDRGPARIRRKGQATGAKKK